MNIQSDITARAAFWSGRANRKEFWLWMAAIFAIGVALGLARVNALQSATTGLVLFAMMRRLHDLGYSGWWAGGLMAVQFTATFLLALTASLEIAAIVGAVLTLAPLAVLGALPGQPFDNRFGPAPGHAPLTDVFS